MHSKNVFLYNSDRLSVHPMTIAGKAKITIQDHALRAVQVETVSYTKQDNNTCVNGQCLERYRLVGLPVRADKSPTGTKPVYIIHL